MKEIEKADIEIADTGENPEAPHPKEMIDLEVLFFRIYFYVHWYLFGFLFDSQKEKQNRCLNARFF